MARKGTPTWSADWLVNRSPLPEILGKPPIRGHLTAVLIALDHDYTAEKPDESLLRT
jgi:hypothetical protein